MLESLMGANKPKHEDQNLEAIRQGTALPTLDEAFKGDEMLTALKSYVEALDMNSPEGKRDLKAFVEAVKRFQDRADSELADYSKEKHAFNKADLILSGFVMGAFGTLLRGPVVGAVLGVAQAAEGALRHSAAADHAVEDAEERIGALKKLKVDVLEKLVQEV